MSRIKNKFAQLKKDGKKALITFVTAGDPDIDATKRFVRKMEAEGADIIELGVPYSDPIAEGPVIQAANTRALRNDLKIKDIMIMAEELREDVKVPLLYLLYYNCIIQYGYDRFFSDCKKSGIDGLIIPDLPYEEKNEIAKYSQEYEIDIITMVTPTSKERIEKLTKDSKGFLYCVSSLGVTGMRGNFSTDFEEFFSIINKYTNIPTAIGFGISSAEQIQYLKKYCDGVIIGSAIVKKIAESKNVEEAEKRLEDIIRSYRKALDK